MRRSVKRIVLPDRLFVPAINQSITFEFTWIDSSILTNLATLNFVISNSLNFESWNLIFFSSESRNYSVEGKREKMKSKWLRLRAVIKGFFFISESRNSVEGIRETWNLHDLIWWPPFSWLFLTGAGGDGYSGPLYPPPQSLQRSAKLLLICHYVNQVIDQTHSTRDNFTKNSISTQSMNTGSDSQIKSLECSPFQWRIQDFPEEGAPTPQGGR